MEPASSPGPLFGTLSVGVVVTVMPPDQSASGTSGWNAVDIVKSINLDGKNEKNEADNGVMMRMITRKR